MPFCATCKGWFCQTHECPPVWEATIALPGYKEEDFDWRLFHARDAEEAARQAAEEYDTEDYSLMRGNTVEVLVRSKTVISDTLRFECCGESVPQYYAKEIKEVE